MENIFFIMMELNFFLMMIVVVIMMVKMMLVMKMVMAMTMVMMIARMIMVAVMFKHNLKSSNRGKLNLCRSHHSTRQSSRGV